MCSELSASSHKSLRLDDRASAKLSRSVNALRQSIGNLYSPKRKPGQRLRGRQPKPWPRIHKGSAQPSSGYCYQPRHRHDSRAEMAEKDDPLSPGKPEDGLRKPADRKLITLQNFYNVLPGDLLRQDLLEFYQLAEAIHDTLGPAGCSVSG
jgi:hypothetical protein